MVLYVISLVEPWCKSGWMWLAAAHNGLKSWRFREWSSEVCCWWAVGWKLIFIVAHQAGRCYSEADYSRLVQAAKMQFSEKRQTSNVVVFGQGECFLVHLKLPSSELFYLGLCFVVPYCYFCICLIISEM